MSWSPRTFARMATLVVPWAETRLWLTPEAVERIRSGLDHGAIEVSEGFVPDEDIVVGFRDPAPLPAGFAEDMAKFRQAVAKRFPHTVTDAYTADVEAARGEPCAAVWIPSERTNRRIAEELGTPYLPWDVGGAFISRDGGPLGRSHLFGGAHPETDALWRIAVAAWMLFAEPFEREITATTTELRSVPTGPKRTGPRSRPVDVSIVDIRRSPAAVRYTRDPDAPAVEHDFRWTRRGHWRMQPCGPKRTQRRKVWIDETVCGPDDKPLRVRPKVHVLRDAG